MTYATIVLHLDQGPRLDNSADFAMRLARSLGSHVTGLAASDRTLFSLTVATGLTLNPELAGAIEATHLRAQARAERFLDRAAAAHFSSVDAVVEDADDVMALIRRSRCCDLMILARPDAPADAATEPYAHAWTRRRLEDVLLQSVAPTLVLPPGHANAELVGHALVGWNGSPEAARAVAGALPLLRRARQVTLLQCDSPYDIRRHDALADIELPRTWLARHGVRVDAWVEATTDEPGQQLLAQAKRVGADLIVMGAWGHWRWSEKLLGGATRSVLDGAQVPLLMAH